MIQAFGLTSNSRKAHPPAVDDVSFEACAGHVTVLLGSAGAGKTTALRLMLELQQGRGITYFRGRPLHRIAHPSREVGVLLGDVPGHPGRSVRGHLRMLCAAAGVPARRADEVLEAVGLVSLREEPLGTLSRGMDRRLGLACALLPDPHTLVLDEPADGLSPREAQWLHGMLRAHADEGGTVLCSTADPKEAARTADRVVTLDGGRLVADQEGREFARTRLRPRVAVRSPHAARLAALLAKEARTARRSVEVVQEGGNRLSVYGSTTADVGETAFRHGILVHQLADEVGDMGPGADAGPDDVASRETSTDAGSEPAKDRGRAVPGSSPAAPETAVGDVPAVEPEAVVRALPVSEPEATVPSLPAVEPEATVGGLPPAERAAAVRGLPAVEPGASGLHVAASASGSSALGLSRTEVRASARDSPESEHAASAPDRRSREPDRTASAPSAREARERRALPFGFSAEDRESGTADISAPRRAASNGPTGEELPTGERTAAVDDAKASPAEVSGPRQGDGYAETAARVPSEDASRADTVAGVEGAAPHEGVEPGHEDALGTGVDLVRGAGPTGAECGGRRSGSGDGPGGDAEAVPAEALAGADGGRTVNAAATVNTGHDAVPAAPEPQTGDTDTPAAGSSDLRTRLPGARNGSRQRQDARAARTGGVRSLDALSPLPPPISVRPARSPLRPLRYEIRRAAGIGVGFLTCGAALVVSALTAVLLARLGHTPQERLFAAWPRELPLPPAALAAGLLGALAFGDEFRHPALAADRGTVPRRLGLLTAKLLVSGATALLLAFLTMGCDAEALYVVYGRELTQVPADWLSLSVSWFALVLGCAWAGVLAAGVFRSTAGGLAAVLAVPVVVVPVVHKAMQGPALRMTVGLPVRMREVLLLQWPFGGERYLLGMVRVLAQPVGGALVLSLSALLCAYLCSTLRARFR
ncbi:ATP-binding cassette domain-containing protein [Streptomyces alanosinicus]|uniref:ATP-binding cassette domain-containing protein n=1 Tax=Streptomyces alanosinicus TaxID=68171 RepID=UPI00167A8DC9|nr:ATP-binding cassette domain-containing protein [Streptomyces alanosinicus]